MRSKGTQGTPQAEAHMGELKTLWQSIPKGADWAISATTLSYSLDSDQSARPQLITVRNAAQWWNAVISNLAVTPDPDDFTIIREELEFLRAKSSTKKPDWINKLVVAGEENPHTSMQTPSALGQSSIQNYGAQNTAAHSSTANPHLQTPHNHPHPMPFPNEPPYQRAQEHRTTLLPFSPPQTPSAQNQRRGSAQGPKLTMMLTATKGLPFKNPEDAIQQRFRPNTRLSPGAIQRNIWFINGVNPEDWQMVSEVKMWVPIGDNKYVGICWKNDQGFPYEPLHPAKKRKIESDPQPKAPPPPPPAPAHLSTIMQQAMMNPMMNHMLPSMQQTPHMLRNPSPMSPYQFPMQNSIMHMPAYNQQAFDPHSTMLTYQQHV